MHIVQTAAELSWDRLSNSALLSAAEAAGFDVLLSGDRNIPSQHTMNERKLAVLCITTNNWPIVLPYVRTLWTQSTTQSPEQQKLYRADTSSREGRATPRRSSEAASPIHSLPNS